MDVFQRAADFFEGIELEDYDLCNGVQKNLNSDVYVHGPLHSKRESGVLYFKKLVKDELRKHLALEQEAGHEIWPARRRQQLHDGVAEDDAMCAAICSRGKTGDIEDF